jgi:hypothetical protein
VGEFVSELRRRVLAAEQSLLAARAEGDDYLQDVHAGELDSLRRLAASHGVALGGAVPAQGGPLRAEPVAG